jgi:hypothetical protein
MDKINVHPLDAALLVILARMGLCQSSTRSALEEERRVCAGKILSLGRRDAPLELYWPESQVLHYFKSLWEEHLVVVTRQHFLSSKVAWHGGIQEYLP